MRRAGAPGTNYERARRTRERRLKNITETLTACTCEWPLVNYRNGHGHGKDAAGNACGAIAFIEVHKAEKQAALDAAEEF